MSESKEYIVRRPVRLGSGKEGQIYPVNTVIGPGHGHYDQAAHESSFPNGAVEVLEGKPSATPSMAVTAPPSATSASRQKKEEPEDAPPEPEDEEAKAKPAGKKK